VAQVSWTAQAHADLDAIHDLIARDSPRVAELFVARVLASTRHLASFPHAGRIVPEKRREDLREVLVQSYRVIYRLRGDLVEVLAVHHGARPLGDLDAGGAG
jgi:plasmid stabilization system protein ParE